MAKSAQIPLHSWLPGSMEGFKGVKHYILIIICILSFYLTDWSDVKYLSLVLLFINSWVTLNTWSIGQIET